MLVAEGDNTRRQGRGSILERKRENCMVTPLKTITTDTELLHNAMSNRGICNKGRAILP